MQTAAKSGYVRVNGEPVKSNHKVKPEDVVTVELPQPVFEFELLPEAMDLDILYEDDDLLVLNKPMDMVVHPGHGNYSGTLVNGMLHHFQNMPSLPNQPEPRPGLGPSFGQGHHGLDGAGQVGAGPDRLERAVL